MIVEESKQNTLSVSRRVNTEAVVNETLYNDILIMAAPFEATDIKNDCNILLTKLMSGADDQLEHMIQTDPDFTFCTVYNPELVPDFDVILSQCNYIRTPDTVIAVRALGLEIAEDGIVDFVHHLNVKIVFDGSKVLFSSNKRKPNLELDEDDKKEYNARDAAN